MRMDCRTAFYLDCASRAAQHQIMKLEITRSDVWAAAIEDHPAGLEEKLAALAAAGANLEFVIGRRTPELPGKGVVFVTPLKGPAQLKVAKAAGFKKADS